MFSRPYSIFLLIFVVSRALITSQPAAPEPGGTTQIRPSGVSVNGARTYGTLRETPWFSHNQIRRDLGITENQYRELETQYRNHYGRYKKNLSELEKENLAAEQLETRRRELSSRMNDDFISSAGDVFPDDAARDRYRQLYWQYRGYDSLGDPLIQQRISLNAEQRQRLNRLEANWNASMTRLNEDYSSDPDRSRREYQELLRNHRKQMTDVLTAEQRAEWQDLTGDPYDFPPEIYFSTPEPRSEAATTPDREQRPNRSGSK